MPITFTNHLDTNVLSALQELINAEFTQSVYYDTEYMQRGTNWFNLVPVADMRYLYNTIGLSPAISERVLILLLFQL